MLDEVGVQKKEQDHIVKSNLFVNWFLTPDLNAEPFLQYPASRAQYQMCHPGLR